MKGANYGWGFDNSDNGCPMAFIAACNFAPAWL
jgi:hypothetical protein